MHDISESLTDKMTETKLATIVVTVDNINLWNMTLKAVSMGAINAAFPHMGISNEIMSIVTATIAILIGIVRTIPITHMAVKIFIKCTALIRYKVSACS